MKLNKIAYFFFYLFYICSFVHAEQSSFQSSIFLGYDSNPLRLSDNEISQIDLYPSILGSASSVGSHFQGFQFKIKHNYVEKKIKVSFNVKAAYYGMISNKNNYNFSLNLKKSLGGYKYFIFDYFLMPDFYLREYEDRDLYFVCEDDLNNCFLSSYFSIEKIRISILMPIKRKISSIRLGFLHERQIFDQHFTEFDLRLVGPIIEYKKKYNEYNYTILFESLIADNYTYLDDSFSTMHMDRSYTQQRYKIAFDKKYYLKRKFGFLIDVFKRKNTSNLTDDNLHYKRSHIDMSISYWHKINSNKISISFRKRQTYSPYEWVRNLKTFSRATITFTKYLNTVKF